MGLKILHIAPFNTAGVPIAFVKAERDLGFESRLVTLGRDSRGYEEDTCLELPFLTSQGTRLAKRLFSNPDKLTIDNRLRATNEIPLQWQPHGWPERALVAFRESLWKGKIDRFKQEIDFWNFDVYQLDGGLEFYRDGRTIRRLKSLGKKIVCCYTGSDLRTRGVIPEIDSLSNLNVALEFDHLKLHPNIHHVFFPFDVRAFELTPVDAAGPIKIGHAPTNRGAKGSDRIISAIRDLQQGHNVELVLIENLPNREALKRKSQCQIFVDQIGDLGYGINSLESLAMGIATCSCLAPHFVEKYPDHPFVVIDESNIQAQLTRLIEDEDARKRRRSEGRDWVIKHHDSKRVVRKILGFANLT